MNTDGSPIYPLSREQLSDALQKGLGRALIHAEQHGLDGAEDLLAHAATHHLAYDPQCECERAPWIKRIAVACGLQKQIIDAVAEAIRARTERYWDAAQQCQLACAFAAQGSAEARAALYASLRRSPDSADIIGAREIIILDGADGLLHVAETIGEWIAADPELQAHDDPLGTFDVEHGDGSGRRVLEAARRTNPSIERYLTALDARDSSEKARLDLNNLELVIDSADLRRKRIQGISLESVLAEIRDTDPSSNRYWFSEWGRYASESDLAKVQQALRSETHPGRITKLMRVFTRRAMPEAPGPILRLAEHHDREVRRVLYMALANVRDPEVRALAVKRLSEGQTAEGEIKMFQANYQAGDETLIECALGVLGSSEEIHDRVFDTVRVFEKNVTLASTRCMILAYERSPCSNCRGAAVNLLIRTRTAPRWILDECLYDADEEIRSAAIAATL